MRNRISLVVRREPSWIMRFMPLVVKRHFAARREEKDLRDMYDMLEPIEVVSGRKELAQQLREQGDQS